MKNISYSQVLDKITTHEFIIIDEVILDLYPEIKELVDNKSIFLIQGPEDSKSFEMLEEGTNFFLSQKITRNDSLLVVGGGATTDLGGFIASTILRGIKWEAIPTTLLAQIDAAIGGKVGINTEHGKNLIGQFHQPEQVYICSKFLGTLPDIELDSGKGELLKYMFMDKEIFELTQSSGLTNEVILKCGEFKQLIVKSDFKEGGQRKILNFGHTLGHAVEKSLNIPHGLAVFCGIEMILKLYGKDYLNSFYELSEKIDLKFEFGKMDFDTFIGFLKNDKKTVSSLDIDIIVPQRPGQVKISRVKIETLIEDIKETLSEYFN